MKNMNMRLPGCGPVHRQLKILFGDSAVYRAMQTKPASRADFDPRLRHDLNLLPGVRVRNRKVLVSVDKVVGFATSVREKRAS
jgi:hypothetical protein